MSLHVFPTCSRLLYTNIMRGELHAVKSVSNTVKSIDIHADPGKQEMEFHRSVIDNRMHVTSLNIQTKKKSVIELSLPRENVLTRVARQVTVPDSAVTGLRNAIVESNRPPKQLQHEADQLSRRLSQRRFPAPPSVVKTIRNMIRTEIKQKNVDKELENDELFPEKIREGFDYDLRNKVNKALKKSNYNWEPLDIDTREGAIAYALARFVPNYSEISRVLAEFSRIDFCPQSILDYGSGVGSGFWAAHVRFASSVKEYYLVDTNDQMTQLAMDIMRSDGSSGRVLVHPNVNFRRHMVPSPKITYDLVICHRTLIEFGSQEARLEMINQLWRRTNRFLVIIEGSSNAAFRAVLEARDHLLVAGNQIHLQDTIALLQKHELMDEICEKLLKDTKISEYERWQMIRERLPKGIEPPTNVSPATVFAPCPHDLGCPMSEVESCTVPIRWRALRADGKRGFSESDGTEQGRISYVIMEKGLRKVAERQNSRVLTCRKMSGHSTCDVCTSFCGLQRFTVSKRGGVLYKRLSSKRDGDLFPLDIKTMATEDRFDLYEKNKH